MQTKSLYVHIPFCDSICSYCDFAKVFYNQKIVDEYLERLSKELESLPHQEMRTIYIGGGTPSSLSENQLERLLMMLEAFNGQSTIEYTMEANPESLSEKKIDLLVKYHVNRLSLGVQTFNEDLLVKIERHHRQEDVFNVIDYAYSQGLTNISIDLMYGLPEQTFQDIKDDLNIALTLPIKHLSYYSLILEEGTQLKNVHYQPINEDDEDMYTDYIRDTLTMNGFLQYEVSNYALEGYQSEHNKVYWHYDNYYGVGVGATSKIDDQLIDHSRALFKYIRGENIISITHLSKEDTMFNQVMMSLRLMEGISLKDFKSRYGISLDEVYDKPLKKNMANGYLVEEGDYIHCTKESLKILNTILLDFL